MRLSYHIGKDRQFLVLYALPMSNILPLVKDVVCTTTLQVFVRFVTHGTAKNVLLLLLRYYFFYNYYY